MIVEPTKEAKRVILDAAWQKQWDDLIASLTKIEWEVLAHAALPNRQHGAFDMVAGMPRHQKASRLKAIDKLLTHDLLRNVFSKNFATISDDGRRALAERAEKMARLTTAKRGT